jgi:hypothetical protein
MLSSLEIAEEGLSPSMLIMDVVFAPDEVGEFELLANVWAYALVVARIDTRPKNMVKSIVIFLDFKLIVIL